MNLISQQNRADLKRRFRKELKRDVTLKFFTTTTSALALPGRECPTCPQAQELLEVTTSLSPKLHLENHDYFSDVDERDRCGVERIPAIILESERGGMLKYYGVPAGYEFALLVQDIIALSRKVSPLMLPTRRALRTVNRPVHIQVFVTPS
jgi:hypothetical protein